MSLDQSLNRLITEVETLNMIGEYVVCTNLYVMRTILSCNTLSVLTEYASRTQQAWVSLFWASTLG